MLFFFLMIRRPPRSTRTDTLFPYTTLFRSMLARVEGRVSFDDTVTKLRDADIQVGPCDPLLERSEEHTSELQSLMRISYAVFCLKKKNTKLCIIHYRITNYIIKSTNYSSTSHIVV